MRLLVCYDVADDKRRNRLAEALLDYGQRVQESVFECDLSRSLAAELDARLRALLSSSEDKLLIVNLCENCVGAVERRGLQPELSEPAFYIL